MSKRFPVLIYVDTSVFGGVFDDEFKNDSIKLFHLVKDDYFKIATSSIVRDEIDLANLSVKSLFQSYFNKMTYLDLDKEIIYLRDQYISSGILTPKSILDATHVAIASANRIPLIISWNFKHIVNYKKIPMYNAVNLSLGYSTVGIYSPKEVIENDQ